MADRTALLLGASGLVGGHLLRELAADARWGRVVTLDRRPLTSAGPTHESVVVDFDRVGEVAERFACDDVFCALGTTINAAGSQAAFRRVDLEIPAEAARLALAHGATQITPDIAQFFGAKHHQHHHQHDQPMPNGESAHDATSLICKGGKNSAITPLWW